MTEIKNKKPRRGGSDGSLAKLLSGVNDPKKIVGENEEVIKAIDIDLLQAGKYQPRKSFDQAALKELSESIKSQGVIQPIVIRELSFNKFEIIAGERRWRASKLAGIKTIPAVIRKLDDKATLAVALVENLQREELKPMDEALALQQLKKEFKLKDVEIAELIGKSKSEVSRLFSLLKLPDCLKALYERGVTSQDTLSQLALAYKENKKETEAFIDGQDSITQTAARDFKNRQKLKAEEDKKVVSTQLIETQALNSSPKVESENSDITVEKTESKDKEVVSTQLFKPQEPVQDTKLKLTTVSEIKVKYKDEVHFINLARSCEDSKFCFIKDNKGEELRVNILDLVLFSIE